MATDRDTDYLKYDASSMLDFLKQKVSEGGVYTDQIYAGSNFSIVLETLAALFEVQTYNLNFQASESTFNGVQIYENMLKIVNMLGYKARATVPSVIHGSFVGNIYLDKVIPNLTATTKNIEELVSGIQSALVAINNPKTVSRNLQFTTPNGNSVFTILENAQVYPEFINLPFNSILSYTSRSYTNESEMILYYLRSIWKLPNLQLSTTLDEMLEMTGAKDKTTMIEKYKSLPSGQTYAQCNLRVSTSDIDNFVIAVNGTWSSTFITSSTTGERNESYNIQDLHVSSTNVSDGTLYAIAYDPSTIQDQGIRVYKQVSSLRNYGSGDRVFEYYVDIDKTITIKFGDGVYGEVLPQNNSLMLFYIVNNGENGEISQSVFTDGQAAISVGSILQRSYDSGLSDQSLALDRFIYDNVDTSNVDKTNCPYISKLLSSANSSNEYTPRMDMFFVPATSSSKFEDIETVDYIRSVAPQYNRTSDRVITKSDLEILLKRDYVQYVYDASIMDNFDYMSKFYKWLYSYDKLSKDVSSNGYKFADSCNFNDIYVWLKSYSNYPVNDFIKKTMERNLQSKKILTSEIVFLDSILTYFYPYVGSIQDDIDWLLYAREKYNFLVKEKNLSDPYYKKWKSIDDLFDKVNGTLLRQPTKRLINYILSGESTELKIEVDAFRDSNMNENMSTIKSNISNCVNKIFSLENNKLGQSIALNELNSEIGKISGLRRIQTTKYRNTNIYTNTGPNIDSVSVLSAKEESSTTDQPILSRVVYDSNIEYPEKPTMSYLALSLNLDNLTNAGFVEDNGEQVITDEAKAFKVRWKIMQLNTGEEFDLDLAQSKDDKTYKIFLRAATAESQSSEYDEQTSGSNANSIIQTGASARRTDEESSYSIYAECYRTIDEGTEDEQILSSYSNKIKFTVVALKPNGTPSQYKLVSYIDDFADTSIELKDSLTTAYSVVNGEPSWEASDRAYSISFAKFTNSMIDAKDFDVVGSGYVTIEDFCFPTLYRDIQSIINVSDEQGTTFGINY